MRKTTTCLYFLLFLSPLFAQQAGIPAPALWLKGNFVSDSLRQASLNFNPALSLVKGDTSILLKRNVENLRSVTVFTVYQDSLPEKEKKIWEMNGEFGELVLSTNQVVSKSRETLVDFEKSKPKGSGSQTQAIIHSYSCPNIAGPASRENRYKVPSIHFGDPSGDHAAKLIAEFMLYKKVLSEEESNKIETYLALKYGITINHDYVNAAGKVVWNADADARFSNNIAGLARDDKSFLLQKQGTSCTSEEKLTIGLDKIAGSNLENTGLLNDDEYLVWGDNGVKLVTPQGLATGDEILLADKRWLIKKAGKGSHNILTELSVSTGEFLPGKFAEKNFYLVINPSASTDFKPENCIYLNPDIISAGVATFKNISWDSDGSGKDKFTFGFKPEIPQQQVISQNPVSRTPQVNASSRISCQVYPNPVTDGHFRATIQLDKPDDIKINIFDLSQQLIFSQELKGQATSEVYGHLNGAPGAYVFQIITPDAVFYRMIILQ